MKNYRIIQLPKSSTLGRIGDLLRKAETTMLMGESPTDVVYRHLGKTVSSSETFIGNAIFLVVTPDACFYVVEKV